MKKHGMRLGLLLGSFAFCAASWAQISDNAVRIGVLSDMNGPFSDLGGKGSVVAAELAIEDFKESRQPSFAIRLLSADHGNKPDIASNLARKWHDTDGVDMIADGLMSSAALAASKVTEQQDRLFMITGSGSNVITNEECSPNTINYAWDSYSIVTTLVRSVTEGGGKKWFLIAADYAFGKSIVEDARPAIEKSGGEVVGVVSHPVGTTDFSSFILQAQSSGADVIGLATAGNDARNALRTANEFGLTQQQEVVMLAGNMLDVRALGLEQTQGLKLVEPFYWDMNDDTRAWS